MLARFDDVAQALDASPESIEQTVGDGRVVALLKAIETTRLALLRRRIEHRPLLSCVDDVARYLAASLAGAPVERLQVLYLNAANRLIRDEIVGSGSTQHVDLHPRPILTRALELRATALIIAHNHPSGDPTPGADDIAATRALASAATALDITLHDHLIVGAQGWSSMRALGAL